MEKVYVNCDSEGIVKSIEHFGKEYEVVDGNINATVKEIIKDFPNFANTWKKAIASGNVIKRTPLIMDKADIEEAVNLEENTQDEVSEEDDLYEVEDDDEEYERIDESAVVEEPEEVEESEETEEQLEEEQEVENVKFSGMALRLVAGGLVCLLVFGPIIALARGCSRKPKAEKQETKIVEQVIDLDSFLNQLKPGLQREAFRTIYNVQNYFNTVAANSVYKDTDGETKLYLTAKEVAALYAVANFNYLGEEKMLEVFGDLGMDRDEIVDSFLKASETLVNYGLLNEKGLASGIADIFENEEDRKLYAETEAEVYSNKNMDERFISIFVSGKTDEDLKDTGAAALISTILNPVAHLKGTVSRSVYDDVVDIGGNQTCKIFGKIEKAEDKVTAENKDLYSDILEFYDKENKVGKDRNVTAKRAEQEIENINNDNKSYNSNSSSNSSSKSSNGSSKKVTKTEEIKDTNGNKTARDEAVKEFGEDKVKEAEDKAKKECEEKIEDENAKQQAWANGFAAVRDTVYEDAITRLYQGASVSASDYAAVVKKAIDGYTGEYKESFAEGVKQGAASGFADANNEYKAWVASQTTQVEATQVNEPAAPVRGLTQNTEGGN